MKFKFDWVVVSSTPSANNVNSTTSTTSLPKGTVLTGSSRSSAAKAAAKRVGPGGSDGSSRPPEGMARRGGSEPKVEVKVSMERMSVSEARERLEQKDTMALAPKMPIVLIRSVKTKVAPKRAGKNAWGIDAVGAGNSKWTGVGVTVAVLDTGIDADHPAFEGVVLEQKNFTTEKLEDLDGHGTHCAGTVFGRDVGGTRIGVARGVSKALIGKIIGSNGGSTESIVNAIHWAKGNGADVISMSVGMDFAGYQEGLVKQGLPARQATSITLEAYRQNILMFERLSQAVQGQPNLVGGVVVVAASGNASDAPNYTIATEPPANSEAFISVAALEKVRRGKQRLASFSNVGAKLAAPGVDILSASAGGGLVQLSGTSMATPHVAGLACLWAEQLRSAGNGAASSDIIVALERSALDLSPGISKMEVLWGGARAP